MDALTLEVVMLSSTNFWMCFAGLTYLAAGVCVFRKKIIAARGWDKLIAFAAKAGVLADTFRACMTSPDSKAAVQRQIEEGQSLKLQSTPTIYINGRESQGADPSTLDQYIRFELSRP